MIRALVDSDLNDQPLYAFLESHNIERWRQEQIVLSVRTALKTTHLHLDNRIIGRLIEKEILRSNRIPSSSNDYDGRSSFVPVDMA